MNIREQLQKGWAESFLNSNLRGILHLCPRSGKTNTSIRIFKEIEAKLGRKPRILVAYPDKNIQQSWEDDFDKFKYKNTESVEYVTHISLGKVVNEDYDITVIDEIHLLSANMKNNLRDLMKTNNKNVILGLSGTLSEKTELELKFECGLDVVEHYTLEQAISDGLISDYRINVIKVPLDNVTIVDKAKNKTEKQKYNNITWVIENRGPNLFLNLARMRIVQNSLSKLEAAKKILLKLKDKRVLVFCASNKAAKELKCKIHTAKFNSQKEFDKFISNSGKHNHYAVCKIGNTGISFKDLDHILIGAFDSNSENLTQRICRSLILDEKDKISTIYIVTSDEKAELRWLEKALEFFDKNKIKYNDDY